MPVALLLTACAAQRASATMVELVSLDPGVYVTVEHLGEERTPFAGVYNLLLDTVPFEAFCVGLGTDVSIFPYQAVLEPVTTINGGLQAGYLYEQFLPEAVDDHHAAALQLAIWEVVEDWGNGLDLLSGDFRVINFADLVTTAESYLAAIPADITPPPQAVILHSDEWQDMLVPEPAVWMLFLVTMGLSPLRKRS